MAVIPTPVQVLVTSVTAIKTGKKFKIISISCWLFYKCYLKLRFPLFSGHWSFLKITLTEFIENSDNNCCNLKAFLELKSPCPKSYHITKPKTGPWNWSQFLFQLLSDSQNSSKNDVMNVVHIAVSWHCKMTSLVNKSDDCSPNYHNILIFLTTTSLKCLHAARIDELADSNESAKISPTLEKLQCLLQKSSLTFVP